MKWICPSFLLIIFFTWIIRDVLGIGSGELDGHVKDLVSSPPNLVAWMSIGVIALVALGTIILVSRVKRYREVYAEQRVRS